MNDSVAWPDERAMNFGEYMEFAKREEIMDANLERASTAHLQRSNNSNGEHLRPLFDDIDLNNV